jgi:hypothetical protein
MVLVEFKFKGDNRQYQINVSCFYLTRLRFTRALFKIANVERSFYPDHEDEEYL